MTFDYRVQPIDIWPGERTPEWKRTRSPFKTIWTKVMKQLSREIRALGGDSVVFRLDISDRDIRNDGMLRADARPRDAGVVVEFTASRLKGKPRLLYRCDRFRFWQDNVSAVARALEALRMVDRYGVTPTGEQYAGFKALPASTSPTMTSEIAAEIVAVFTEFSPATVLNNPAVAKDVVRTARAKAHPLLSRSTDGWTLEVTRVATDGAHNACSILYGAAWRAAKALGYRHLITYTLKSEPGTSLRGEAGGGTWSRKDRPRVDKHPLQEKLKWEAA